MSSGITFRCTCEHCGAIFFGPDRKASACVKCAKRYRLRVETPTPAAPTMADPDDELFASALAATTSTKTASAGAPPRRRPEAPKSETTGAPRTTGAASPRPHTPPSSGSRPPAARTPRATELTEELRATILSHYAEWEGRDDIPLRRVHAEIADKVNAARSLVASVLAEVRTPQVALTEEQRQAAVERYRDYVRRMERPAAGRRTSISRELGIGRQQVVTAVREWAAGQPSITDLSREELFRIERAFFQYADGSIPIAEISQRVAEELGYSEWQVERWIDVLHDGEFRDIEEIAPDQREAVIAAYLEYLQGDGPPPRSLHMVMGERFGLHPRQVHKVLVDYRLACRLETFGF